MAQFLAVVKRNTDAFSEAEFGPLLEPEAGRARQLYAQGVVRAMWSRKDVLGAVLLIEAENQTEVEGLLNTLPLKAKGMLDVESIVPIGPYRGFGPRTP